jgi:hypothetical protein
MCGEAGCPGDRQIRQQFWIGVRQCVATAIWNHIRSAWYDRASQADIAKRLGIDAASVSRGISQGEFSFETFLLCLIRARRGWRDLPPLPPSEDLISAGYARAIGYVRYRDGGVRVPDSVYVWLRALYCHDRGVWYAGHRHDSQPHVRQERELIAADVLTQVGQAYVYPPGSAGTLDAVLDVYGPAYLCVVDAVLLGDPP